MAVKEHYDNHLGNFYSWMLGDFHEKQVEQERFFRTHRIGPVSNKVAFDLGAGNGLQSISLAKLDFNVKAIDFNKQLLKELEQNKENYQIEIIEDDLLHFVETTNQRADVIVCMGDTLTHLDSMNDVEKLIQHISVHLNRNGKVIFSFRDLTHELPGDERFIPVKSDSKRILTCFLEYFPEKVIVHDLLHENINGSWQQKISSYPKLRLNEKIVSEILQRHELKIISAEIINRMIYLIAKK